jgi:hypothetical protein
MHCPACLRYVFLDNDEHLSCFFWQGVCVVLAFPLLIFLKSSLFFPAHLQISMQVSQVLLTHFVCSRTISAPADVFDFGQIVSFLFTFFPPAELRHDFMVSCAVFRTGVCRRQVLQANRIFNLCRLRERCVGDFGRVAPERCEAKL